MTVLVLALLGCGQPVADIFVTEPGEPVPWLDADRRAAYDRGRAVVERRFRTDEGLGPTFNADSCVSCHQFPVAGGSAPRYRDFWLVRAPRWDGALEDGGSNGEGPVRNLYALGVSGAPSHIPEPEGTAVYARRNAPSGLGIGLLAFVPEEEILRREDPDDRDGDGISGRANYEQGRIGRFGYKLQASTMESFNRGAIFNQVGITTDPLFFDFPEDPRVQDEIAAAQGPWWQRALPTWLGGPAFAQVSAPDEPTVDDDGVPDPELSNDDQRDMLMYSTFLAPLAFAQVGEHEAGEARFGELGCAECHVPELKSTIGRIPAYTDLLLHDMGPELADGLGAGLATGSEFRTQPLWGVALHGPFLHDGRADTLDAAIHWHGGEAEASRLAYEALDLAQQAEVLDFLASLGGWDPDGAILAADRFPVPAAGEAGGPATGLSAEEQARWLRGRAIFDRSLPVDEGLGTTFNADSCRACHQAPVLGGAAGIDTNVVRYGRREADGTYTALGAAVLPRSVIPGALPVRPPDGANVIEWRNPPSALGLGLLDLVADESILANADPDDADGDGVSGRPHLLADGRVGRYGWKAQVPTLLDFAADASLNELGHTLDPALSTFAGSGHDDDEAPDPELSEADALDLAFYLQKLGPPAGRPRDAEADAGAPLFAQAGCDACHLPSLGGVPAYTDLLLHEVAPDPLALVDQEPGLQAGEFRTSPLWGVIDTGPYLHDGLAPTLDAAIRRGHFGEASASREAYEALSPEDQGRLLKFVESL